MTESVVIELEGPPVAWARTRVNVGGRRPKFFTPTEQRNYALSLQYAAMEAMRGRTLMTGPISINVTARLPIPPSWTKKKQLEAREGRIRPTSKPDYDNFGKLVGDSLNTVVYCDDAQICDGHIRKIYSDDPGLRVEVSKLDGSTNTTEDAA